MSFWSTAYLGNSVVSRVVGLRPGWFLFSRCRALEYGSLSDTGRQEGRLVLTNIRRGQSLQCAEISSRFSLTIGKNRICDDSSYPKTVSLHQRERRDTSTNRVSMLPKMPAMIGLCPFMSAARETANHLTIKNLCRVSASCRCSGLANKILLTRMSLWLAAGNGLFINW